MTAKMTLLPGQKGTKHLVGKYGERLIGVRYRYDAATQRRYTTVERIEAEAPWAEPITQAREPPPPEPIRVGVRIAYGETELRE